MWRAGCRCGVYVCVCCRFIVGKMAPPQVASLPGNWWVEEEGSPARDSLTHFTWSSGRGINLLGICITAGYVRQNI